MGGVIGFGMAEYAPERVSSFVIGGSSPYANSLGTAFCQVDGTDPEAFIAAFEARLGISFPPEIKSQVLDNDLQALVASAQDWPSLEEILPSMTMPCLLYVGEADGSFPRAKECAQHMPNVTFVTLPALNHAEAFWQIDLMLQHVTKFLKAVSEKRSG